MKYVKPQKLKSGDLVAIVSPSWGGPSLFPHVYENGLKVLRYWGLKIKEMPSARMSPDYLWANPRFRANDINNAIADKKVKAIFTSIGGDDSVRILPFLDKKIIKNNPKIFLGYSDATTIHTYCNINGLVTFYGPSVMAGFSQMENLPSRFEKDAKNMLFTSSDSYVYQGYGEHCEGYEDWSKKENVGKTKKMIKNKPWNFIQGDKIVNGRLFGGCIEVLEFLKGTEYWPKKSFWKNKILFLETSEDKPSVTKVRDYLRNYGMQGILQNLSAILFGRARGYSKKEKNDLNDIILEVVNREFGLQKISIVTEMDFGHTDPQIVIPLGIEAQIDCKNRKFSLKEDWFNKNK
jgi:muramoyltetrapeptide carboxypeptidase LdcA involved in peptidoglycan recycling